MKTSLPVLALLLSSLSLAFQLKKPAPTPVFDKFMGPANITEFEYRVLSADIQMLRSATPYQQGIGVSFVKELSKDHQHVTIRTFISEGELPKGYDERKKALLAKAIFSAGTVAGTFDLNGEDLNAVRVEFVNLTDFLKAPNDVKPFAEWKDEELTFH
jgi:hypothetical protein